MHNPIPPPPLNHSENGEPHDSTKPAASSSPIFRGIVFGWITFFAMLAVIIIGGNYTEITDLHFVWDLRVNLFLTAVTVITRVTVTIAGVMVPSILAGIIAFDQKPILRGTGNSLSILLEASISRNLFSTIKSCLKPGNFRKVAFIIASILVWQYATYAADLFLHVTANGRTQRLPGPVIQSNRTLSISDDCTEDFTYSDSCGLSETVATQSIRDSTRALRVYQNSSDTLQIWRADGGIYLLQSAPPEKAYSYSGSGIFLKPSCEVVSNICKLTAVSGARTSYDCPKSLWSASGDLFNTAYVNVTTKSYNPATKNYTALNPIHAIISIEINGEMQKHDSGFVHEVHASLYAIVLHCQMLAHRIEYTITLGSLEAKFLSNFTNPQLLVIGSASNRWTQRVAFDTEDVAWQGNSQLFADALAQKWAQVTLAAFSGAVKEGEKGYLYYPEVNKDQTIAPFSSVIVYLLVINFPFLIFASLGLFSFCDVKRDSWIISEFFCRPQRLLCYSLIEKHHVGDLCSTTLKEQENQFAKFECQVGFIEGHFGLKKSQNI
ncbi:9374_t:CDS:1 [Ambispora gerdemannii]|uniref:9374_t:CDS:1 n=1 Tax=Ambispora gerdemannii TaxID=144530 RepID=A0A9N9DZC6_9GLOM|nr:9374_t:CDS:1 [Ambispora gerdemannii]